MCEYPKNENCQCEKCRRINAYGYFTKRERPIPYCRTMPESAQVEDIKEDSEILDIRAEMKRDRESLRDCVDNGKLSIDYRKECLDRLAGMSSGTISVPVALR